MVAGCSCHSLSDSQPRAGLFPPCCFCRHHHPSCLSTSRAHGSWAKLQPPQSDSIPFVAPVEPGVREVTVPSPVLTTVLRFCCQYLILPGQQAQRHVWALRLGTQRLLPESDILTSSKWLLLLICSARSAGLGSCSGRIAQAACSPVPCMWEGFCPLTTCPTHSSTYTLTHTCSHSPQLDFQVDCPVV